MKPYLIYLGTLILLNSCNLASNSKQNDSAAGNTTDQSSQFQMELIPGSNIELASKKDPEGNIIEEGTTDAKGLKNGIWVIYQGEGGYPEKIANYVKGLYNGPYFEFDSFGRMALRATYKNNKLHGSAVKFLNGNISQESNYKDGILDGVYKEYNRYGAIQKEINYKNGKLDGPFRYYDDNGKVTLEYIYKNGKQQ